MKILFVCTGNTCRSPFAVAVARRGGHADAESAGLAAYAGDGPPVDAVSVARERGLDLSTHRARPLDTEMLDRAEVVVGMTAAHVGELEARGAHGKARLLGTADIADPIDRGPEAYRRAYDQIETAVQALLEGRA
jgi:protein-tyrosine-phosphatase